MGTIQRLGALMDRPRWLGSGSCFLLYFVMLPEIPIIRIFGLKKNYSDIIANISGNGKWLRGIGM